MHSPTLSACNHNDLDEGNQGNVPFDLQTTKKNEALNCKTENFGNEKSKKVCNDASRSHFGTFDRNQKMLCNLNEPKQREFQNFRNQNSSTLTTAEQRNLLSSTSNSFMSGFYEYSPYQSSLSESDLSDISCISDGVCKSTPSNTDFQDDDEIKEKESNKKESSEKNFSTKELNSTSGAFHASTPFCNENAMEIEDSSTAAYKLLSDTIKKEIHHTLEVLVEKSTKSLLSKLKQKSLRHYMSPPVAMETSNDATINRPKDVQLAENDDVPKLIPISTNVMVEGDTEQMKTAKRSQMCFGEVSFKNDLENENSTSKPHYDSSKGQNREECRAKAFNEEKTSGITDLSKRGVAKSSANCDHITHHFLPSLPKESMKRNYDSANFLSRSNGSSISPFQNYSSYFDPAFSNISKTIHNDLTTFSMPQVPPETKLLSSSSFLAPLPSVSLPHPTPILTPHFNAYQAAILSNLMKPPGSELKTQSITPFNTFPLSPMWVPKYLPPLTPSSNSDTSFSSVQEAPRKFYNQTNLQSFLGKIDTKPRRHHLPKSDPFNYKIVRRVSSFATIRDGLTPQHLRKAKLMFFYTRYPNTSTIKAYFKDVEFTRATTSQLIKWFSNFREFFYIQVEKFARQAINEGVTETEQLKVGKYSDLFRVLKHHFNKNSDYKIPQEFLSVTEKSLQEFFLAINKAKDFEPSWKKSIYKIICKLDQEIPEYFKNVCISRNLQKLD